MNEFEPRAGTRCGQHAERNADQAGDDEGVDRDQNRVRKPIEDQLRDRLAGQQRAPEVALERMQEPDPVLHHERLIETVELPDLGDALLGRIVARQHHRRIARYELQQREHHEGSEHDDRQQLPQAAADQTRKLAHGGSLSKISAVMAGPAKGLVPAISIRKAHRIHKRDARDKPAHDDPEVCLVHIQTKR